ncbi:MAG: GNAT family N-acetyltransferase, partial [Planctomycetia bacterium]
MDNSSEPRTDVFTIRSATPTDTPALVALACSSGLFRTEELGTFQEMLDDYHTQKASSCHEILTYEKGGNLHGIAWYCPRVFTDRVWELLMIAVDANHHRQGIGSQLL